MQQKIVLYVVIECHTGGISHESMYNDGAYTKEQPFTPSRYGYFR